MDQREFDALVRRLAQEATRRRVMGTGLGAAGAAFTAAVTDIAAKAKGGKKEDRDAGKKKGKARKGATDATPAVSAESVSPERVDTGPDDQGCIATGKKCRKKKNGKVRNKCGKCCSQLSDGKTCICLVEGGACTADANCCAGSCIDGVCGAGPEPACRELGAACKNVAPGCCDGLVCASGQGGEADVACYVPKTGPCRSTADCVFGLTCTDGRCSPPPPVGLAEACAATVGQGCTTPGAVCTAYDGGGAPLGTYCTLPLGSVCTGNRDCTCYKCGPANVNSNSRRRGRDERAEARLVCCGDIGYPCSADRNCCGSTICLAGRCATLS